MYTIELFKSAKNENIQNIKSVQGNRPDRKCARFLRCHLYLNVNHDYQSLA